MPRRAPLVAARIALLAATAGLAPPYPSRAARIVVPFGAGALADFEF